MMHVRLPRSSAISRGGPRSSNLGDCAGVGQEARQNKLRRKDASISDPRNDPQKVTHEMAHCQLGAQTPAPISYLPWYATNICETVRLRFSCSPTPIEHSPSQLSKTKNLAQVLWLAPFVREVVGHNLKHKHVARTFGCASVCL